MPELEEEEEEEVAELAPASSFPPDSHLTPTRGCQSPARTQPVSQRRETPDIVHIPYGGEGLPFSGQGQNIQSIPVLSAKIQNGRDPPPHLLAKS